MTRRHRWLIVLGCLAVLLALPRVVAAVPVLGVPDRSAADVLARTLASSGIAYSGYAQTDGAVGLPVTDGQLASIADLFGGGNQLRVWVASATSWRLDSVGPAGERDIHADDEGSWTWDYERNTATRVIFRGSPAARLPSTEDLLPPNLARRLLSEATPAEASRLPARRIAGRAAAGLRVIPAAPISTVSHIDVWADLATGLPLRTEVYAKGGQTAALTSSFLDLRLGTPGRSVLDFRLPDHAMIRSGDRPDLVSAIDRFGQAILPRTLAGLGRNTALPAAGHIGVYGSGVTELLAIPLPERVADDLRDQLHNRPGVGEQQWSQTVSVGPLNAVLYTDPRGGQDWLLAGTVLAAPLAGALSALRAAQ
jgi:outer membrane lipoprotein-sorting protein